MSICPAGGFFFQSTSGDRGNFEVVIPGPEFGLWHYWRDNDDSALPWHGPNKFAEGFRFTSVTVCESDYRTHDNDEPGNFELLARRRDGAVILFWRENGGSWSWSGPADLITTGTAGNPSLIATGRWQGLGHGWEEKKRYLLSATPAEDRGFLIHERGWDSNNDLTWSEFEKVRSPKLSGLALLVSPIPNYQPAYEHMYPGNRVVAWVAEDGRLGLSETSWPKTVHEPNDWVHFRFGVDDELPDLGPIFTGRPSIIMSDFGFSDGTGIFDRETYGHYELAVPLKSGGVRMLWKKNGHTYVGLENPIEKAWHDVETVGSAPYHEVSIIQSNFGAENGNIEMVARERHQAGFDFFWRDDLGWHGPFTIS